MGAHRRRAAPRACRTIGPSILGDQIEALARSPSTAKGYQTTPDAHPAALQVLCDRASPTSSALARPGESRASRTGGTCCTTFGQARPCPSTSCRRPGAADAGKEFQKISPDPPAGRRRDHRRGCRSPIPVGAADHESPWKRWGRARAIRRAWARPRRHPARRRAILTIVDYYDAGGPPSVRINKAPEANERERDRAA